MHTNSNLQPVVEMEEVYEALRPANADWLADAVSEVAFTGDVLYLRRQIQKHTGLKIEAAA